MEKPEDVPQDVWDRAGKALEPVAGTYAPAQLLIAKAILAAVEDENEACAQEVYSATDSMHEEGDIVLKEIIAEAIRNRRNRKGA